jgi:hypothetical protein
MEVLTAVKVSKLMFWIVAPPGFVDTNVSEENTVSIFRAQDGDSWYIPTSPHGVTTQKNNIDKDSLML